MQTLCKFVGPAHSAQIGGVAGSDCARSGCARSRPAAACRCPAKRGRLSRRVVCRVRLIASVLRHCAVVSCCECFARVCPGPARRGWSAGDVPGRLASVGARVQAWLHQWLCLCGLQADGVLWICRLCRLHVQGDVWGSAATGVGVDLRWRRDDRAGVLHVSRRRRILCTAGVTAADLRWARQPHRIADKSVKGLQATLYLWGNHGCSVLW